MNAIRQQSFTSAVRLLECCFALALLATLAALPLRAQQTTIVWTPQEQPIVDQLKGLRKLPDDERVGATQKLALQIRQLPAVPNKLILASLLTGLSTEGDFGHDTLREVTNTLADTLRQQPQPEVKGQPAEAYIQLASLVRYEHVQASLDNPQYRAAMAKLEADDLLRQKINFTLNDLNSKSWTLQDLHGKVVLVNFWATWCPPCRKEMPDLESLYRQFGPQGLVVLAISDEDAAKVKPFLEARGITYTVLLDPGRKVTGSFQVDGIPKSFVYDREGKLVAQSIDMRTRQQFLAMLAQAGLH